MIEKMKEFKFVTVAIACGIGAVLAVLGGNSALALMMCLAGLFFVWLGLRTITGSSLTRVYIDKDLVRDVKTAFTSPNQAEREAVFLREGGITPPELEHLALSTSEFEREYAAMNPLTPVIALESLRKENNAGNVLEGLLANPRLPEHIRYEVGDKLDSITLPVGVEVMEEKHEAPTQKAEPKPVASVSVNDVSTLENLRSNMNYDRMESFLSDPSITVAALETVEPMVIDRPSVNQVVQNTGVDLPIVSMAYIASKSAAFRAGLVARITQKDSRYAGMEAKEVINTILSEG